MIRVSIPGRGELEIRHAVFDFNGTLATDGKMSAKTIEMMGLLKQQVNVHILTSDTYGTVRSACQDLDVDLETISSEKASGQKKHFVERYGATHTCCVGNGVNDAEMFEVSALAVMVIGEEGGSVKALQRADIVVTKIEDAIGLLLNPQRIVAALRE